MDTCVRTPLLAYSSLSVSKVFRVRLCIHTVPSCPPQDTANAMSWSSQQPVSSLSYRNDLTVFCNRYIPRLDG